MRTYSRLWPTRSPQRAYHLQRVTQYASRWHHHDDWELFLPTGCPGRALIGDYAERFHTGQLYVVPAYMPHMFYRLDKPGQGGRAAGWVLNFIPQMLEAHADELAGLSRFVQRAGCGLLYTGKVVEQIGSAMHRLQTQEGIEGWARVLLIVDQLIKSRSTQALAGADYFHRYTRVGSQRVDMICRHIHAHFTGSIRLDELADLLRTSEETVCRLFQRNTGRTVLQYVNELRISRACELLAQTDMNITDIAQQSGYPTLGHFNRMFRRHKKTTPLKYRQTSR